MKKFKPGHVSLERGLSKLGIASRTVARGWILEGKVRVNGVLRRDPDFAIVPERAKIEIDGESAKKAQWQTYLLHKPRGYVTTHSDEKGRKTVFSLMPAEAGYLIAVGRLDLATTGLLILTNDTQLAAWLTDPSSGVRRTYLVTVRGEVTDERLGKMRQGVVDEGEQLSPQSVILRKSSRKESHLVVTLTEGKNREIRRLFISFGHQVTRLKRVAYGGLELGDLEPGKTRELSMEEVQRCFPGVPVRRNE